MKEYRAAALFFGDAWRMGFQSPSDTFLTVSFAYYLLAVGKLADAQEYLTHLVEKVPHALAFACVSILRHFEASTARAEEEMRKLSEEQVQLFEKASALP